MLNFACDYAKGAHPNILKALCDTNDNSYSGYGADPYTSSAKEKIKKACNCPDADIFLLVGGTQTNSTVIANMLRPYEGVVSAVTGHVSVHEAGAVEYTGHKVLTIPEHQGKINSDELKQYLNDFAADANCEHMVYPGMVYISHPTEYGTLYSASELDSIYDICKSYDIPLFVDGARLGYALAGKDTDVDLEYLSKHCDVFYIGGTKVGALFGEAVVFPNGNSPKHFYTMTKQHGALLAKSWLLGLQFDILFTDDLYMNISQNAIDKAEKLKELLQKHNIKEFLFTPTNQQFVILKNSQIDILSKHVAIDYWETYDSNHSVMRFATSWYTTDSDIKELDRILALI